MRLDAETELKIETDSTQFVIAHFPSFYYKFGILISDLHFLTLPFPFNAIPFYHTTICRVHQLIDEIKGRGVLNLHKQAKGSTTGNQAQESSPLVDRNFAPLTHTYTREATRRAFWRAQTFTEAVTMTVALLHCLAK